MDSAEAKAGDGDPKPTFNFGTEATNVQIVLRVLGKLVKSPPAAGGIAPAAEANLAVEARLKTMEAAISAQRETMSEQTNMLKSLLADRICKDKQAPEPVELHAEMLSMVGNGKCCYQAAGVALALVGGGDPDDMAKGNEEKVAEAEKHIVKNIIAIAEEVENFSCGANPTERQEDSAKIWKTVLGERADDVLIRVNEGKEYGGYVELAASTHHTDAELIVVDADGVHAKASDASVEVAVYPALLNGLPPGPPKKRRLFLVLEQKHYYFAYTSTGGD